MTFKTGMRSCLLYLSLSNDNSYGLVWKHCESSMHFHFLTKERLSWFRKRQLHKWYFFQYYFRNMFCRFNFNNFLKCISKQKYAKYERIDWLKSNTRSEIQTLLNQNNSSKEKTTLLSFSSQWDELSIWASDRLVQHLQDFTRGVAHFHIIIFIIIKYQRKLHRSRGVKHSHQHRQLTTVGITQRPVAKYRVHLFCSVHHGWCKFAAWKRAR